MAKSPVQKLKLRVEEDGKRLYVAVPMQWAGDLHAYLRANRMSSSPPEPAFTGMDYIELPQGTDVARLQTLLDDWCARVARKPI